MTSMSHLRSLDDDQLVASLQGLIARSNQVSTDIIVRLAEMEARKLYLVQGYTSLYAWCVGELNLSEDVASKRLRVARVVREFPTAISYLREGRLHVSAVVQLAPKLTEDNHQELLDRASGKSCAEIREVLAELFPSPDVATLIRRKPRTSALQTETVFAETPPVPDVKRVPVEAARVVEPAPDDEREELDLAGGGQAGPGARAELKLEAPVDRGRVEPLSAERFAVRFTASGTLVAKLDELKRLVAPRIAAAVLSILWNRWTTARTLRIPRMRGGRGLIRIGCWPNRFASGRPRIRCAWV